MMKSRPAKPKFAPGTSRGTRNARTLLLQMAMEEEQRAAMGRRISALRNAKRLRQPAVADAVGVTLRAYQAWEAGDSGIKWENAEALARVLETKPDYVMYGDEHETDTPDPLPSTQLDRIEKALAAAGSERESIRGLLARQSDILEGIERLLAAQLSAAKQMEEAAAELRSLRSQERPEEPTDTQ